MVLRKNDQVRLNRDWESQLGRAVTEDYEKTFDPTAGPSSDRGVSDVTDLILEITCGVLLAKGIVQIGRRLWKN